MQMPFETTQVENERTGPALSSSPSHSSHHLSSATSSFSNRKSASLLPTTYSGSPPRTHMSSPTPTPGPWQNYRAELVRRFSRDGATSKNPINPVVANDPERHAVSGEESVGLRKTTPVQPATDTRYNIRRASYTSAIFRGPEEAMPSADTDGQQWGPGSPQGATTATAAVNVSASQSTGSDPALAQHVSLPPSHNDHSSSRTQSTAPRRPSRSRASNTRIVNGRRQSNASPGSERSAQASEDGKSGERRRPPLGVLGVCALDSKARSKPSRNILNRINAKSEFELIIFGDKVILDEEPKDWPVCDYLIAFFSEGFPLDKAIEYARLRKPFSVNDLPMQAVLWDRRLCLHILDRFEVTTPQRVEVTRDGGPRLTSADMARHIYERTGLELPGPSDGTGGGAPLTQSVQMIDDDTLCVDGQILHKPFVEKPVSGEDHNIRIYYSSDIGGGGRRLFRKVNNKSSDADDTLNIPRSVTEPKSSYIYESFLSTSNHEDVKAYTVGSGFCHAETRKSPVVDGIVKRNTHGKEMRYVTSLSREETIMASKISEAFGQRICGFDLLRVGNQSFVIDVNGWSFVKDNNEYYDKCAAILKQLFVEDKQRKEGHILSMDGETSPTREASGHPSATHFQRMKSILKSPSMSRLSGHHNHSRAHRQSGHTPPGSTPTPASLSAGPTLERPEKISQPQFTNTGTEIPTDPTVPSNLLDFGATELPSAVQAEEAVPMPQAKSQWKLKGMVAVVRHADRTPKQKLKFTFNTKPFVDLLKGHKEEVLLTGEPALESVMEAVRLALVEGIEDIDKLRLLLNTLMKKAALAGTKVQIKPMFKKDKDKDKAKDKSKHGQNKSNAGKELTEHIVPTESRPVSRDITPDLNDPEISERVYRQGSVSGITMSREAAAEENLGFEKLQLILKWGGEPTHSARYQSQELGENMRNDLLLMNRDAIDDLAVYSSSERRVTTSAQMWTAAFLDKNDVPPDYIQIRKDLLDDSNAAKDEMDKVKKKLKSLLRKGQKAPPQFAWPENMPEPYIVARNVVELMKFHRLVMRDNFRTLYGSTASSTSLAAMTRSSGSMKSPRLGSSAPGGGTASLTRAQTINGIQNRWCSGEDADLFKERWEKLFDEFCDPEKVDPSKISELHDTMKYDALHNRQFLEWVFTPSSEMLESYFGEPKLPETKTTDSDIMAERKLSARSDSVKSKSPLPEKWADNHDKSGISGFFRKRPSLDPNAVSKSMSDAAHESYFNLFKGTSQARCNTDIRLEKLRELFLYAKVLFDFIGPQEYGILDSEKLEIGLLTSLPLLRAIVNDLEDMQASEGAKTSCYFTKESHIYTLLNCIIEGGVTTKIERNKIPELDYLSTICFELYESANKPHPPPSVSSTRTAASDPSLPSPASQTQDNKIDPFTSSENDTFNYSIRITISPGCHTFEPLDVQLDSRHTIGFAQRRSLTAHNDYKAVIETLRDKFHTVKLPKSFVAVNLSEKVPQAFIGPKLEDDVESQGASKTDLHAGLGIDELNGETDIAAKMLDDDVVTSLGPTRSDAA